MFDVLSALAATVMRMSVSRSLAERTRGFAARASSPSGGAVTSLASRSAIANSAVERVLSSARPPRFFGGYRAHQADKPHDLRASARDPRLGDESALAPRDLDEAAFGQILNCLPHDRAVDLKSLDQAAFRRHLGRRQAAVSDIAGQNRFDTFVEGDHDITTT